VPRHEPAPEPDAEHVEVGEAERPPVAEALAAFYDRRAPAALAYCARLCEPESIAEAVQEAFSVVYAGAADGGRSDEELDVLLRDAVHSSAAKRASYSTSAAEAERAYEALTGEDAPALGRSLLAEVLDSETARPEPARAEPEPAAAPPPVAQARPEPPPPPPPPPPSPPVQRVAPPPKPSTLVALPPPARTRRRLRLPRLAAGWRRRLAILLGVVGVLLLTEVLVTLVWKEPFTAYLTSQTQDDLSTQLGHRRLALQSSEQRTLAAIGNPDERTRERMALLAQHLDAAVPDGEALGRIEIPKLGVNYVFVQGTNTGDLKKGPGHYRGDTLLPGEGRTVGLAGHRTTYAAPFREIDELKAGDHVTLQMPYGRFTYEVTGHRIVPADYRLAFVDRGGAGGGGVPPTANGGSGAAGGELLVLSACHPLYNASQRILVDAKLVASRPLGAAAATTPAEKLSPAQIAHRRYVARLRTLGHGRLAPGMSGPEIRQLQRLLGMPVTGLFDPNTTAAVVAFQRDRGLPQVGVVGRRTKRLLARRTHPPSRPPTPAPVVPPPTKYAPSP
jgi:sortase A